MGCNTFCCWLLVRLDPDEREPGDGRTAAKGFVDKDTDGCCVHLDQRTNLCRVWERRPRICREYDCNTDFLLQVVLAEGFTSVVQLVRAAVRAYIPKEMFIRVPYRGQA